MRRWPRSSKNNRNFSRIWSAVTRASLRARRRALTPPTGEKGDQNRRERPHEVEVDPVDRDDLRGQQCHGQRGGRPKQVVRPPGKCERAPEREPDRERLDECLDGVERGPAAPDTEWRRRPQLVPERRVVELAEPAVGD